MELGLEAGGGRGVFSRDVGEQAPGAVEEAGAIGERDAGVLELLVDREHRLDPLERGPPGPAVEGLGARAAGDLGEGDEALLRDVELAVELPVLGLEEVARAVARRDLGGDVLAGVFAALVLPGALPRGPLGQAGRLVDVGRVVRDGVLGERALDELAQAEVGPAGQHLADGEDARVVLQRGDHLLDGEGAPAALGRRLDAIGQVLAQGLLLLVGVVGAVPAALEVRRLDQRERGHLGDARSARLDPRAQARRRLGRQLGQRRPAMNPEPRRRLLARIVADSQRPADLGVARREAQAPREPGRRRRIDRVGRDERRRVVEAVEAVAEPVELLLQRDHEAQVELVLRAARLERPAQPGRVRPRARVAQDRADRALSAGPRQLVEALRVGRREREVRRDREELHLRRVVLEELLPVRRCDATALSPQALVVEDLLHPEARGRRVEQAQQREVVVLGRARRELDDRRAAVEDLAAAVEDEVVVGGDERERELQRAEVSVGVEH